MSVRVGKLLINGFVTFILGPIKTVLRQVSVPYAVSVGRGKLEGMLFYLPVFRFSTSNLLYADNALFPSIVVNATRLGVGVFPRTSEHIAISELVELNGRVITFDILLLVSVGLMPSRLDVTVHSRDIVDN